MSPRQAYDIGRMPPGDRGPALRALLARSTAKWEAVLSGGPDLTPRREAALTRAEWALRKIRSLARLHGVDLGITDMPVAPGLSREQRRALADALADPVACAALADACLSRHSLGTAPHA